MDDLGSLLVKVSPIPVSWAREDGVQRSLPGSWRSQDGLLWPPSENASAWTRWVAGEGLSDAWALWTLLTSKGLGRVEVGELARQFVTVGGGRGVLGSALRGCWCTEPMRGGTLVALGGGAGAKAVRPGASVEEKALDLGYPIYWSAGWAALGAADYKVPKIVRVRRGGRRPELLERGGLAALVDMEAQRALQWLAADVALGRTLVLGPGPVAANTTAGARRAGGFLRADGTLTMAGWWRLAFGAQQGIGSIECYRQERLAEPRIRRHLRMVQRLTEELMEQQNCVPLGSEYSATSIIVGRSFYNYRPDALLRGEDGELIWLEVMRRPIKREHRNLRFSGSRKYELLPTDVLPQLADRLERPVRYVLQLPDGTTQRVFRPMAGSGW